MELSAESEAEDTTRSLSDFTHNSQHLRGMAHKSVWEDQVPLNLHQTSVWM